MINSYPSIYNLGHKAITDLLKGPVIVEEKIDGSQLSFMVADGNLHIRSKGATIYPEDAGMFSQAVTYLTAIKDRIPQGLIFRGEYLSKPKHNILAYERTPSNNTIIFDVDDGSEDYYTPVQKRECAASIDLDTVPVLYEGMITDADQIRALLETESVLGGQKIEGVVIKPANYDLFGRDKRVLLGKFVSEAFKEVHAKDWKKTPGNKDILTILSASYGTEPRWNKAVQHLREAGLLEDSPRDIGKIMAEVPNDILKECEADIREALFKWAWPQLRRVFTRGLPEWYKQKLMDKQFEGGVSATNVESTDESVTRDEHAPSNFPVPVLADSHHADREASNPNRKQNGEARESNRQPKAGECPASPSDLDGTHRGGE